jgi:hypothetical protein
MRRASRWVRALAACGVGCAMLGAAVAQVLPASIQACRKESDDARRLACFDRETARFPLTPEQSLGLSSAQIEARQTAPAAAPKFKPTQLRARVVALRERPHAGFVVTLDNGQVWTQNEMEAHLGVHEGDLVTIQPAKLGGFWLVGPSGWATKVRRAQ